MYRHSPTQRLILASGSPRRRELLGACGLAPEIIVSNTDEAVLPAERPEALVERLSALKAGSVADQHPEAWVLGGDTIVVLDGEILGKPENPRHAEAMLQKMQGRSHAVWGSFSIINRMRAVTVTRSHRSLVTMVPLSAARIAAYVATGEPLDKAGSYALQGIGAGLVSSVEGSHSNVIGLNLSAVLEDLERLGVIEVAGRS
jgi:septum formation protein